MSTKTRVLALAVLAVVAAAVPVGLFAFAGDGEPEGDFRGSLPPEGIELPELRLADQDGDMIRTEDLRGKVALVTFLDTQCEESCPLIASAVADGLERLTPEERERVVALAVSVDPAEDTPASVRRFLASRGAEDALRYVVAPEAELRPLWDAFGVLPSADSGSDDLHSAPVRIYDPSGVWAATLHTGADLTPQNLVHDVRVALAS
ncbi:MAG TPA: SCO family protein [Gaiellaceae bacterium]|jgi:protein SCO1/2|nr:SCO family protein [Gaiellaceae bacterium]